MQEENLKLGQYIYYFHRDKHSINIRRGRVCELKRWGIWIKKCSIGIGGEISLDLDDVFFTEQDAIDYLKSEVKRLEKSDWGC